MMGDASISNKSVPTSSKGQIWHQPPKRQKQELRTGQRSLLLQKEPHSIGNQALLPNIGKVLMNVDFQVPVFGLLPPDREILLGFPDGYLQLLAKEPQFLFNIAKPIHVWFLSLWPEKSGRILYKPDHDEKVWSAVDGPALEAKCLIVELL